MFVLELVSRTLVLGVFGGSGNVIKNVVMRAGPFQGNFLWRAGAGFDLEVVSRAFVLEVFGGSGNAIKIVLMRSGPLQGA